jgi:hypothetical protein
VARFTAQGRWLGLERLTAACALAAAPAAVWAAGGEQALALGQPGGPARVPPALRVDNHWLAVF